MMNYNKMVSLKEANKQENAFSQIVVSSESAIKIVDGVKRWLEDKQEIKFAIPQFMGKNAEFPIVNTPNQKIWFSQLSSRGISEDFNLPLLDEIILKGHSKCYICENFKTARDFWDVVKGKKFLVTVIGNGFCLNRNSSIVNTLKMPVVPGRSVSIENVDKNIFEYIRNAVKHGNIECVRGTLKYKTAYCLTEI